MRFSKTSAVEIYLNIIYYARLSKGLINGWLLWRGPEALIFICKSLRNNKYGRRIVSSSDQAHFGR